MNSHLEGHATVLQAEPTIVTDAKIPTVETTVSNPEAATETKVRVEEFQINGEYLIGKVRELIRQGNLRRLIFKNSQGRTLLDIPLVVGVAGGVVGVALFPFAAALTAVGALVTRVTVVVERKE